MEASFGRSKGLLTQSNASGPIFAATGTVCINLRSTIESDECCIALRMFALNAGKHHLGIERNSLDPVSLDLIRTGKSLRLSSAGVLHSFVFMVPTTALARKKHAFRQHSNKANFLYDFADEP
jgi:hypothetical protein